MIRALHNDSRGAVFVEKLIVTIPVLLTFFLGWELAEVGAASLVVQRASAAAGRAAMVVLPDDPAYYGDEPPNSYTGARRAEIELAAGMVLSAIPKLSDDFEVDVSQPPQGFGKIDVTVRAPYECGNVGLICGLGERLALSATTTHAYHGAKYDYTTPAGGDTGVGSTAQALTATARSGAGPSDVGLVTQGLGGSGFKCGKGNGIDAFTGDSKNEGVHLGNQRKNGKYGEGTSEEAIKYRCAKKGTGGDVKGGNLAVIKFNCGGESEYVVAPSDSKANSHSEPEVYKLYQARKDALGENGKCTIQDFYTEREPCDDGANCSAWFTTQFAAAEGLSPSEVNSLISFDFSYNPKRDVDVTKDPYYADMKKACTQVRADIKKNAAQCGNGSPGRDVSCKDVQKLVQDYGVTNTKVGDCLEFLQAKEDFEARGPRKQFEAETKKTLRNVSCAGVDTSQYK